MSIIDNIESFLVKYLSSHSSGQNIFDSEISFIKSGSQSSVMNYAIIYRMFDPEKQKRIIKKNFNVDGFVISFPEDGRLVQGIESFSYLGRILVAQSNGFSGERVHPEIRVEPLSDNNIKDYISFMNSERSIEPEILNEIIESCRKDLYIYLAYDDDEVVGAGSAIKNDNKIFIFDTIVKEEKRNSGFFSAIVTQSMSDVSKEGEYLYYALISSPESLQGAAKANYHKTMFMDLWINKKDGIE